MSQQLKPIEDVIEVPKETGKAGLLRVLEGIIDLKRVVEIRVLAPRAPIKVSYKRYVVEGEPDRPLSVDLESLAPYAVLRNGEIQEFDSELALGPHWMRAPAAVVVAHLFREVSLVGLWPIAFVAGRASYFWNWHRQTMSMTPSQSREDAYGLPFMTDRQVADDTLLLAASYDRAASIIDAQRAFKLLLPAPVAKSEVEVT